VTPTLSWAGGSGAASHDVYFGTSSTPPLAGNVSGTSYQPGNLSAGAQYFWRVVAKNSAGSTSSPTWTFTTQAAQAPQHAPQAVSSNPASGSGATQTFAFTFSDANGHADLHSARVLIHPQLQAASSCYLYYTRADNKLHLHDDAGSSLGSPLTVGQAGTISNSQCSVNGAASSAAASGNILTLNLAITFTSGFAGSKTVFGYAQDVGGLNSGWRTLGTWIVPSGGGGTPAPAPAPPQAVSASPASGSGTAQTFAFTFSDANGHGDIQWALVLMHQQLLATNSCYVYYLRSSNRIYLQNDGGDTLLGPVTLGVGGTVSNSQCTINGSTSSAAANGNTLTLNLAIIFKSSFAGSKNIFAYAQDVGGLNSGWRTLGTWTVPEGGGGPGPAPAPAAPQVGPVNPASGSGSTQTFAFSFSDANGHADIQWARVVIHEQLQAWGSCYLYYSKADNQLYLYTDGGYSVGSPLTVGQAGAIGNSQCSVNGAASSASAGGNTLTLNLAITFSSGFAGSKNVFGFVQDAGGRQSGWQFAGTWIVPAGGGGGGGAPGPSAPQAVSANPASGSGAAQTFSFTFSDANGYSDIHSTRVLIHQQLQEANSCYLYYVRSINRLYLLNDTGNELTSSVPVGADRTIANSQCSLRGAASSVTASGNTLTLNLAITFTPGYAGPKTMFGYAQDNGYQVSGWQTLGTWTVQ
jgi:hypothetical protein